MQPEINRVKENYFGDADTISEKQLEIYRRYGYNAMASIVPLIVQVLILLGLVEVIYNPLRYIFCLPDGLCAAMSTLAAQLTGIDASASSIQMTAVAAMKDAANFGAFLALQEEFLDLDMNIVLEQIRGFKMAFLGLDLSLIPVEAMGATLIVPLIAAFSAWLMCVTQNHDQVLQAEQGK